MITVEINNVEYNLPESWEEVKLKNYVDLHNTYKQEHRTTSEKNIAIIASLLDVDTDVLLKLTPRSFIELTDNLDWVKDNKTLADKSKKAGDIDYFTIGKDKYKLIDLDNITMGEKITIEMYAEEHKDDSSYLFIIDLLPLMLRKVKTKKVDGKKVEELEEYNTDNHNEYKELFLNNLNITDVFKLPAFFLSGDKK